MINPASDRARTGGLPIWAPSVRAKRDVTTPRDPPLSFLGENLCRQPASASSRCEKNRNVLVIAKRKQKDRE